MSFNDDVYRDQLYTEQQSRILVTVPRITGALSILGSAAIIYIIAQDWKKKLRKVYHRLLLSFSIFDLVCSLNYALSSVVVPKGTPGVWGASGTAATCEASGFFMNFTFTVAVYATFICVYYLLVLKYGIRERTIARRIEPAVHFVAILYPILLGGIALRKDLYNPANIGVGFCFLNCYPMDCLRNEDIECERGGDYEWWLVAHSSPVFLFFGVVVISSLLTAHAVRSTELRGQRWSISHENSRFRIRESTTQAYLYIAAFFLVYSAFGVAFLIGMPATRENRAVYFWLVLNSRIFLPMQGLFNFFIYVRPRYNEIRRRRPEMSSLSIFRSIVAGVTMTSLARLPSAAQLSARFVLPGVGMSFSSNDASPMAGKNALKCSASLGQDLDLQEEISDEKDDFLTPEMQAIGFFQENQMRQTSEPPCIMGTSVENSTGDSENVSIREECSAEAVGKSTTQSTTLAKDEETKDPESIDENLSEMLGRNETQEFSSGDIQRSLSSAVGTGHA